MADLIRAAKRITPAWAVAASFAACGGASMTVAQVESVLRERTPAGVGHERVITVLDSLEVEHSAFNPQERYVLAMWRKTSRSMFVDKSIQARFLFDDGGRLIKYEVKELSTGT